MSYHDLLMQYGSEADSAEQRIYIYAQAPKKLKTTAEVVYRDRTAEQDINRLEKLPPPFCDVFHRFDIRPLLFVQSPYIPVCIFVHYSILLYIPKGI